MRILLADDHNLFREAIVQYIERAAPEAIVMTARDIHGVMDILEEHPPLDLVLLDLRMPGMNGLQGLEKLRAKWPELTVALMSGLAEPADVEAAMKLGARGYFPKTLSGKALLAGIRLILSGETFVATDHNTGEVMPSNFDDSARRKTDGYAGLGDLVQAAVAPVGGPFTPREQQVLEFLKHGESNKEIARALGLQVVTVKLHVRGVCRKLGAKNRTQAALIAREKGL